MIFLKSAYFPTQNLFFRKKRKFPIRRNDLWFKTDFLLDGISCTCVSFSNPCIEPHTESGWIKLEKMESGETGLVPSDYVEPICNPVEGIYHEID